MDKVFIVQLEHKSECLDDCISNVFACKDLEVAKVAMKKLFDEIIEEEEIDEEECEVIFEDMSAHIHSNCFFYEWDIRISVEEVMTNSDNVHIYR